MEDELDVEEDLTELGGNGRKREKKGPCGKKKREQFRTECTEAGQANRMKLCVKEKR